MIYKGIENVNSYSFKKNIILRLLIEMEKIEGTRNDG